MVSFSRQCVHAERKQRWLRSGVLSKMAEDSVRKLLNKLWLAFFGAQKSILLASYNYG